MLTLLHPEAHEVTSAVIVPEAGGFKIVVNKGPLQIIKWQKQANTSMAFFRRNFALTKCEWKR